MIRTELQTVEARKKKQGKKKTWQMYLKKRERQKSSKDITEMDNWRNRQQ